MSAAANPAFSSPPPYDVKDEVTWFISVTKESSWSRETFEHEYCDVHAKMVQEESKSADVLRGYTQVAVSASAETEKLHPGWDFVTCLTWANTFSIWAGFQNPKYKEAAGKHVFCRLDQKGSIAKKIAEFMPNHRSGNIASQKSQVLVFHRRERSDDEATDTWLKDRLQKAKEFSEGTSGLHAYTLLKDVTPKNTDAFFADTQFSRGSWLEYKAVERYEFGSNKAALDFLERNRAALIGNGAEASPPSIVVGTPRVVV